MSRIVLEVLVGGLRLPVLVRQMYFLTRRRLLVRCQGPPELRQAQETISTRSKELARLTQLNSSVKCLEDNVALYEVSEDYLKIELAAEINNSTRLSQLVYDICAEVVDL